MADVRWRGGFGLIDWKGRRGGGGERYPEECSACPRCAGQLHRGAKTAV